MTLILIISIVFYTGAKLLRDRPGHSSVQLHCKKGTWSIPRAISSWSCWSGTNNSGTQLFDASQHCMDACALKVFDLCPVWKNRHRSQKNYLRKCCAVWDWTRLILSTMDKYQQSSGLTTNDALKSLLYQVGLYNECTTRIFIWCSHKKIFTVWSITCVDPQCKFFYFLSLYKSKIYWMIFFPSSPLEYLCPSGLLFLIFLI